MPNYNTPITFLPTKEIRDWYESLEAGNKTKILNGFLTRSINIETNIESPTMTKDQLNQYMKRMALTIPKPLWLILCSIVNMLP